MDLSQDHFALLGLPARFAIDDAALDGAYRALQSRVHPDRHAASSATDQRIALQWATRANEAYRVLRDPLSRAIYLCRLAGHDAADEGNTTMPHAFLVQQIEWREALDDAVETDDRAALAALSGELTSHREELRRDVGAMLDRDDATGAVARVREWMFVERFADDVARAVERLETRAPASKALEF